jgi:hypothetical protein
MGQPKHTVLFQNAAADAGDSAIAVTSKIMLLALEAVGGDFFGASIAVLFQPIEEYGDEGEFTTQFQQAHFEDGSDMVFTEPVVDITIEKVPRFSRLKLVMSGGDVDGTTDITAVILEVE